MKYALTFVTVLLVGVSACAVEPGNQPTDDTSLSTSSSQLSVAGSESTNRTSVTQQDVTCSDVWECDQICGFFNNNGILVRFPTNVLHQECSDGSDTVLHTDPCGEACF